MSPDELTREIQAIRGVGWVICDWRARSRCSAASAEEIEAYLEAVELKALGELGHESPESGGWREITLREAENIVTHWMRHDLAYGLVSKNSEAERAARAAGYFLGAFTGAVKLYTNAAEAQSGFRWTSSSWTPKTRHTFDRGIVAMDEHTIGLVWFADED